MYLTGSLIFIILLGLYIYAAKPLNNKILFALTISVSILKLFIALTMGHYDIYRFIVFIQQFIAHSNLSPWDYSLTHPDADFPYPPWLLYLHTLVFLPFREHLILVTPYVPNAYGYMLIRIPFILCDIALLSYFIRLFQKTGHTQTASLLFLLLNPIILFHQFYSGQFDLIAVLFFFLFTVELTEKGFTNLTCLWLFLSLALKPFGILFLGPILLAFVIKIYQKSSSITIFGHTLRPVILYLIGIFGFCLLSQMPYLLTHSYQTQMGAGSKVLLGKDFLFHHALFLPVYAVACAVLLGFAFKKNIPNIYMHLVIIGVLAFSATTDHSAGWVTWCVPFIIYLALHQTLHELWLYWIWGGLFIFRWTLVDHSPAFDSLDVFLNHFLHVKTPYFGIGYFYHLISAKYSIHMADFWVTASAKSFALMSWIILLQHLLYIGRRENNKL